MERGGHGDGGIYRIAALLERADEGVGLSPLTPPTPKGEQLAAAFSSPPLLNVRTYADYRAMKWSKLLLNIMGNATSALLDLPVSDIYRDPKLFAVEMRMLREALTVMCARDPPIAVVNLPGNPARALARAVTLLPDALLQPILARRVAKGRGDKRPSLYYDVVNRTNRSEVTALNGALTEMVLRAVSGELGVLPAQARATLERLV